MEELQQQPYPIMRSIYRYEFILSIYMTQLLKKLQTFPICDNGLKFVFTGNDILMQ